MRANCKSNYSAKILICYSPIKKSLSGEVEAKRLDNDRLASELRMKDDMIKKLSLNLDEAQQIIQERDQEIENLMHDHRENRQDLLAQIENLRIENDSKNCY